MKLSIDLPFPTLEHPVDYSSRLLFLGSCFASAVGERFSRVKFDACVNPFGVLFNPYSVLDAVDRIVQCRHFRAEDFFESDGRYLSLALHSDHSYPDLATALREVNALLDRLHAQVPQWTHVFLTFGTAQVYRYRPTGEICANCHKIPQREFSKERMSVGEIVSMARRTQEALRVVNPGVTIVYTVSPVRYLDEGPLGNSASKGVLFCAVEELTGTQGQVYLPVYEYIMDQLRDYRFFGPDMVHPNELAVDCLWERLAPVLFSRPTQQAIGEVEAVVRAADHRPFHPEGEGYRRHCRMSMERIRAVKGRYPSLDFSREEAVFTARK